MFRITFKFCFVIAIFFSEIYAQTDTVFTTLAGMEDKQGSTHLIYQIYTANLHGDNDTARTDYYRFDLSSKFEKLIFDSYKVKSKVRPYPNDSYSKSISGFTFFNHDPNQYLYSFNYISGETTSGFGNKDGSNYYNTGSIYYLQAYGDSVWAQYSGEVIISSDRGAIWSAGNNVSFHLISVSSFNRNIFFGYGNYGSLVRSLDQGKTFSTVHNKDYWFYPSQMFYDRDQKHIYALTRNYGHSDILISDRAGDENSWNALLQYKDSKTLFAIDDSVSGEIYYSEGNKIFKSSNYGATFVLLKDFAEVVTGIYKKPNSQTLYCSTKTSIYEITGNQTRVLKHFSLKNTLALYPLNTGNKWYYHTTGWYDDFVMHPIDRIEKVAITGDTVLQNGNKYFIKKKTTSEGWKEIEFVRIDSSTTQVYVNHGYENEEDKIAAYLTVVPGDKINIWIGEIYNVKDSLKSIFGTHRRSKSFRVGSLNIAGQEYTEGLGLVWEARGFDFGYTNSNLNGCVINGTLYGDTLIVGVEETQPIPTQYSLSQNYPNPFNPSTVIRYELPDRKFVTLKVFDVLGRQVTTLVNEYESSGIHKVVFNAQNLSSGVYFCQLRAGRDIVITKKMVLLK